MEAKWKVRREKTEQSASLSASAPKGPLRAHTQTSPTDSFLPHLHFELKRDRAFKSHSEKNT